MISPGLLFWKRPFQGGDMSASLLIKRHFQGTSLKVSKAQHPLADYRRSHSKQDDGLKRNKAEFGKETNCQNRIFRCVTW